MTDVAVGVTLPQFTDDPRALVDTALFAEEIGLDSVWVFDHLWPLSGGKTRPILESWTALAYLARATSRIRIGTLVTRSSLRHPALLAKMAATVGAIAPGRVTIAIGSGDAMSRDENQAFGLPYWSGAERGDQLRSTVATVRAHLRDGHVSHSDGFVTVKGLPVSPRPDPAPALWVGGGSEDAIAVAAAHADGWNAWGVGPERFAADAATLAELAGERPVEPTWGGLVDFASDVPPSVHVSGSVDEVTSGLRRLVDAGARHLIATFRRSAERSNLERLAREVRPRLA